MSRARLQSSVSLTLLVMACGFIFTVGASDAWAFYCTESQCDDYSEGFCEDSGGVDFNGFDAPNDYCHGKCNNGDWIGAFCEGSGPPEI